MITKFYKSISYQVLTNYFLLSIDFKLQKKTDLLIFALASSLRHHFALGVIFDARSLRGAPTQWPSLELPSQKTTSFI